MKRRGLNENAISIERIARDVEQEQREGWQERARAVRQEIPHYRKLPAQKRFDNNGKIKRYKNLATFNRECGAQSTMGRDRMFCALHDYRVLADGTAMASVDVRAWTKTNRDQNGTWLLHYGSPRLLERDLIKRVTGSGQELQRFKDKQKPSR